MDDPGKKNLRFAIKWMAFDSSRKSAREKITSNFMNILHERPVDSPHISSVGNQQGTHRVD